MTGKLYLWGKCTHIKPIHISLANIYRPVLVEELSAYNICELCCGTWHVAAVIGPPKLQQQRQHGKSVDMSTISVTRSCAPFRCLMIYSRAHLILPDVFIRINYRWYYITVIITIIITIIIIIIIITIILLEMITS